MPESKPKEVSFSEEEKSKLEIIKRKNGHPNDRSLSDVYKDENEGSFKIASIDFLYDEALKIPEFTPEQIEIINNYAKKSGRAISENPFETIRSFHGRMFSMMSRKKIYGDKPEDLTNFISQIPNMSEIDAANIKKFMELDGNQLSFARGILSISQLQIGLENICDAYQLDIRKPVMEILNDPIIKRKFPNFNYSNEIKIPLLEELDKKGTADLVDFMQSLPKDFENFLNDSVARMNEILGSRFELFLDRNTNRIKFTKRHDWLGFPSYDYSRTEQWKNLKDFLVTGKSEVYGEADQDGEVDEEGVYRGLNRFIEEAKERKDYTIIETDDSTELVPHNKTSTSNTLN